MKKQKEKPLAVSGAASSDPALSEKEFDALLAPFHPLQQMAIAVSGGPDSMALAYCLGRWAKANNKPTPLCLIVDHRLRSESEEEAKDVQKRLCDLGLTAEILVWAHPKIESRIHVEARRARYALLLAACRKQGIDRLFLAHQKEDQAETILFRLAKGSGPEGLAGIAEKTDKDGILLVRPLLGVPKERLIATCTKAKIAFVTDPSNSVEKYARGRLRRILPVLQDEGLTIDRLIDLGQRARETKDALDYFTKSFCNAAISFDKVGVVRVRLDAFRAAPQAIALRALSTCLSIIQPMTYAPQRALLLPLVSALRAETTFPPRTFAGSLITRRDDVILLFRESGTIDEEKEIRPGQTLLWDNRWHVHLSEKADGAYTIKALTSLTHDQIDRLSPRLRRLIPGGRIRATLPALWRQDELVFIPDFTGEDANAISTAELHKRFYGRIEG